MAFQLPVFNLVANIWRNGNPVSNPPDVVTMANLAVGRRTGTLLVNTASSGNAFGGMWLLVPARTDIRDGKALGGADVVEVPGSSGKYYDVFWVDDLGSGFSNEHRFGEIVAKPPWPVPFPGGGGGPPPPPVGLPINVGLTFPLVSVTYHFTAAGGPIMICVANITDAGATLTVLSNAVGILTPVAQRGNIGVGSSSLGRILFYLYTPPSGPEFVTFSFTSPVACFITMHGSTLGTFDTTANDLQTGLGSMDLINISTGFAGPVDGFAANLYVSDPFDAAFGFSGWTPDPFGSIPTILDNHGFSWQWQTGIFSGIGPVSTSASVTGSGTVATQSQVMVGVLTD